MVVKDIEWEKTSKLPYSFRPCQVVVAAAAAAAAAAACCSIV